MNIKDTFNKTAAIMMFKVLHSQHKKETPLATGKALALHLKKQQGVGSS